MNAALERAKLSQTGQGERQEDRQQFEVENPNVSRRGVTQGTLTQLQKTREALPGNPVSRYLFGRQANERLLGALSSVLEQRGTLGAVSKAAQALKAGEQLNAEEQQWLQSLGPYEQEYLKLLTGQ